MTEATVECKQQIVCILGMHRSGTSLLTRMLNLMGVSLGPEHLLMPPSSANPKGYWEHDEIVAVNHEILRRFGGSWDEPPMFSPDWENDPIIDDLKERARALIQDLFANVENWCWKDPRTCLTLRFWQQLLPEMLYVVCLRNPVDVAYSLQRRDGLSGKKSSDLWLTYVSSALEQSEGKPRLVIFYEDLMDDCFGELQRLADFLGKPALAKQADVKVAVQEFVEKGLEHSRTSMVQAAASTMITPRTKARYLAHRISVSLRGRETNKGEELDHQIEEALDILSQSSFKLSDHANQLETQLARLEDQLAKSGNTLRTLQARLTQQDKDLEANSVRLAANEQALKMLSNQLLEKDGKIQTLSTRLDEKDGIVQTLSSKFAEKAGALQSQTESAEERIAVVSAQLFNTQTELEKITDTLGWRLLKRYGRIKYGYLLPVYRLFGQKPQRNKLKRF